MSSILVLIPTLNEAATIERVVDSLSRGLPTDKVVRFVIVDGGSTDGTIEKVRDRSVTRSDITVFENPRRLQSAGIDDAVRALGSEFEFMVRCDAHALYPDCYIADLLATLERTDADSVVVPMDSTGSTCFQKAVAWVSDTPMGSGGSAHRAGRRSDWVDHGHHAAMRISSYLAAGGYDPTMSHNEDAEFDCRLRAIGGKIWLASEIRIGYLPRRSLVALARQYYNYGRGRSRTVRRHPGSMRLRQAAVPSHVVLIGLTVAAGLLLHPLFLAYPAAYLAALSIGALAIALEHRSACGLYAAPAAAAMHIAWAVGFFVGLATIRESKWSPIAGAVDPLATGI